MMAAAALKPAQIRAIEALLTHDRRDEAATAARVSERSLRRWLAEPTFRDALAAHRTRLLGDATSTLARGAARAAAALVEMAEGKSATAARVAAARAVIDLALKAAEVDDLARRLEALEAKAAEREVLAALRKVGIQ